MEEIVLFKIDVDVKKAEQAIIDYQVELEKLKKQKKEIEDANKRGELSEQEYAKKIVETQREIKKVSQAQKEAQKQIELATKVQEANKNSYESLTLQYAQAKKALNQLENAFRVNADGSIELTEEYKKQAEEVKKLKDAIIAFDQNVSAGQTNVGNYTQSFKDAIAQTKVFGVSVGEVQQGLGQLSQVGIKGVLKGLLDLGKAIIASPLGILLITVGAIVSVFSKSKAITGALSQAFSALGQALDAVFIVLEPIIEGFAKLITFGADALSGLVSFLTGAEANASELDGRLQDINDKLELQSDITKRLEAEAQKQKNIVEDTNKSIKERLEASQKQFELEAENVDKQLELETEKANILAEQLKTMGNTNERFEKQKELSEQNAKVQELIAQKEKAREELIKKTNKLLKEQKEDLLTLSQAELNLAIAQGKIQAGSIEELREKQKLIRENAELQKQDVEDEVKRAIIEKKAQAEILQLENEFNKNLAEKNKERAEKYKEIAEERVKLSEETQKALVETELIIAQAQAEANEKATEQRLAKVKEGSKEGLQILAEASAKQIELNEKVVEKQRQLNELETQQKLAQLDREAKELKSKGIDTRKFVEAAKNRILQESLAKEQALIADHTSKVLETELNLAKKLQELRRQENEQALKESILALQNQIALKKQLGEQDIASQLELAKTENSLKLEQLRTQLADRLITQKEFDELYLQAKIEFEDKVNAINQESYQREAERINKQAEINRAVMSSYAELGEAVFSFAEQSEESQKALFVLQKTAALAEVAINLQRELSLISANPAINADPTQVSKIIAITSAIARGAKIVAEIKKATFAEGGYTGDGEKYEIAGIVHRGEYVVPKWQVENEKYRPIISILEQGRLRGFATGGGVGINPIADPSDNITRLVDAIAQMRPVVDVQEIITKANRLQVIENRASF
jgi:hypothetical protein